MSNPSEEAAVVSNGCASMTEGLTGMLEAMQRMAADAAAGRPVDSRYLDAFRIIVTAVEGLRDACASFVPEYRAAGEALEAALKGDN